MRGLGLANGIGHRHCEEQVVALHLTRRHRTGETVGHGVLFCLCLVDRRLDDAALGQRLGLTKMPPIALLPALSSDRRAPGEVDDPLPRVKLSASALLGSFIGTVGAQAVAPYVR